MGARRMAAAEIPVAVYTGNILQGRVHSCAVDVVVLTSIDRLAVTRVLSVEVVLRVGRFLADKDDVGQPPRYHLRGNERLGITEAGFIISRIYVGRGGP